MDGSYSCYVDEKASLNYGLIGEGSTGQEAINEWGAVYEAMKESYSKDGRPFVEAEFNLYMMCLIVEISQVSLV